MLLTRRGVCVGKESRSLSKKKSVLCWRESDYLRSYYLCHGSNSFNVSVGSHAVSTGMGKGLRRIAKD